MDPCYLCLLHSPCFHLYTSALIVRGFQVLICFPPVLCICLTICTVTATLLNFVRLFRKAHEENLKQAELERKKVQKEAEMENAKGVNLTKKGFK